MKKLSRDIHISLPMEEYEKVCAHLDKTNCRSVSEYVRKRITGEPITVYYRDQAYDEFIEAAIQLKRRLDGLLLKDMLAGEDMQELTQGIPIIKDLLTKIYDHVQQTKIR